MYKMSMRLAAITCICLFMWMDSPLSADSTFTVSSYIPQKLVDFEWYLEGGYGFQRNQHTHELHSYGTQDYEMRQDVDLTSITNYRYRTIPRFFGWKTTSTAFVYHQTSEKDFLHEPYNKGRETSFQPAISSTLELGQYCLSDLFAMTSAYVSWSYQSLSTTNDPSTKENGDAKTYDVDPSIAVGWGRIYEGEYAATAMYMIDELKRNGYLDREPTDQEMLDLTEIIYQYRLKHAIDTRKHKIEALSSIMDFMVERGLIEYADPLDYLFVADVWDYFPRTSRRFGMQVKLEYGFLGKYQYNQHTYAEVIEGYSTYDHGTRSHQYSYLSAVAGYEYPFALRWQLTLTGTFRYVYNERESVTRTRIEYPSGTIHPLTSGSGPFAYCTTVISFPLKYIYDSRTTASIEPRLSLNDDGNAFTTYFYLNGSATYRISIPTTLTFNWSLQYRHATFDTNNERQSYFKFGFSLGVAHYLF